MDRRSIDRRLRRIDQEIEQLQAERRQLKLDRDRLIQKKNRAGKARFESDLPTKILLILVDNPGLSLSELCACLGDSYSRRQVSHSLYNLSRPHRRKVENRGGQTLTARWYVVNPN